MAAGLGRRAKGRGMKPNSPSFPTLLLPAPMESILIEIGQRIGSDVAASFREAFTATEIAADGCFHHAQFSQAIALICAQPRPLHERLTDIFEIVETPGRITIHIRRP
jgi:hypothetical protein